MAAGRRVDPGTADPLDPGPRVREGGGDVGGVRAVDDEPVGRAHVVDPLDGRAQGGAVGQPAVGLDGEPHRDREPRLTPGQDDPDRLVGGGEGQGGEEVGALVGEDPRLRQVVVAGLPRVHRLAGHVPVATRPHHPGHHDLRDGVGVLPREPGDEAHGGRVGTGEPLGPDPQPGAPVVVGPPRRGLQEQARPGRRGDLGIAVVVRAEQVAPLGVGEQQEGGELGQLHPVVEDQVGLQTAVGDVAGQVGVGGPRVCPPRAHPASLRRGGRRVDLLSRVGCTGRAAGWLR